MATRTLKIGLSATDKTNMAQDVYDRLIDTVFEDYSSSSTYKVGDFVVYNNVLYRCITAVATPEAWNSSKWEVATFQDLVDDVQEMTNARPYFFIDSDGYMCINYGSDNNITID